ncbi:MAG: hypothetical protein BWY09_00605 [Candidatus Hydrogenedentes bacterium ADurb.Bin179]|nr:MAG: hypothetical protein BWY09_00605 [Candidatus Hydrogenedentes bacterium ADurb.Bin179]
MNANASIILEEMSSHNGYKDWLRENRSSEGRFWNLLRADIMGLDRKGLLDYLDDDKNRLNEQEPRRGMNGLGQKLKQQFTDDPGLQPEDLIVACLEMDLACRCKAWGRMPAASARLKLLEEVLGIRKMD